MTDREWYVSAEQVTNWSPRPIARGTFGEVYTASYYGTNVAVKRLLGGYNQSDLDRFSQEVGIWYRFNHPNILSLLGACDTAEKPFMVSAFMANGTLQSYVSDEAAIRPLETKLKLMYQVASGMAYLHGKNTIHGDLKPQNILLDDSFQAVISDFGMARTKQATATSITIDRHAGGTLIYMAPEMLDLEQPRGASFKTDVFAFGISLYEVLNDGKDIWVDVDGRPLNLRTIERQICNGRRPPRLGRIPEAIWALIEKCWHQDPTQRPTFTSILATLEPYQLRAPPQGVAFFEPGARLADVVAPEGNEPPPAYPAYQYDQHPPVQANPPVRYAQPAAPQFGPGPPRAEAALQDNLAMLLGDEELDALRVKAQSGDHSKFLDAAEILLAMLHRTDPVWRGALESFQTASAKNVEATFALGWMHLMGLGTAKDERKALRVWVDVQPSKGLMGIFTGPTDIERAICDLIPVLRRWCYAAGYGTFVNWTRWKNTPERPLIDSPHHQKLVRWCTLSAPTDPFCKFMLGQCHHEGIGTPRDRRLSSRIFEELANEGYPLAQVQIGHCYWNGYGVARDDGCALHWFRTAADRGCAWGQSSLGDCYRFGVGVPKDHDQAEAWRQQAARNGFPN